MINPIFDIENWKEIFATLSRNKTRTFLTAFGIFWGTAMLAMLLGGADGLKALMSKQFDGFATNTAFVWGNQTSMPYKGFKKGMYWSLDTEDLERVSKIKGVRDATGSMSHWGMTITYGRQRSSSGLMGVMPAYTEFMHPIIVEGRFINESDESAARKVCVLGKRVASTLFGAESPLGKNIAVGGIYYKVVGVCEARSEITVNGNLSESVIIPLATMRKAFNYGDAIGLMMLIAEDGYDFKDLEEPIKRAIRQNHPIHPDDAKAIEFMNISEMFEMINNLFLGLSILAGFVGFGTLLAGIIGVGNIMWVIVKERTTEIGIRRALGAKPRDIIVQILSEGVVLTFIAGVAGICFAAGVLGGVNYLMTLQGNPAGFQLGFGTAVAITVVFAVLGTAAGIIPAVKAMRIKPIEAINDK